MYTKVVIISREHNAPCVRNHKCFINDTIEIPPNVNHVIYLRILINITE
jgi:hypothetical protein